MAFLVLNRLVRTVANVTYTITDRDMSSATCSCLVLQVTTQLTRDCAVSCEASGTSRHMSHET
jgi:hypothetical protein